MDPGHNGDAMGVNCMQRHHMMSFRFRRPCRLAAGFTLIEILIALTILGILLGIAVPIYQNYMIRARVAEALQMAVAPQLLATEDFLRNGDFAAVAASYSFPAGGSEYVDSIVINPANGAIRVTTRDTGAAVNPVIDFIPAPSALGILNWTCTLVAGETRHVPRSCTPPAPSP